MALISASEAKLYIPGLSGTDEDSKLTTLITRVGILIAVYLGYPPASETTSPTLEQTTYTEYYTGPGGLVLPLGIRPVTSITSIYEDPERVYGASTLVASTNYELDGRRGEVILKSSATHGSWNRGGYRAIKATFVAGWATAPEDVKEVAIEEVRVRWNRRYVKGIQTASGGAKNVTPVKDFELLEESKLALAHRRLPGVVL